MLTKCLHMTSENEHGFNFMFVGFGYIFSSEFSYYEIFNGLIARKRLQENENTNNLTTQRQ